jgi:Protein of unknown function (DUF3141)
MAARDRLARSQDVAMRVGLVLHKRTQGATVRYVRRVAEAVQPKGRGTAGALSVPPPHPLEFFRYAQDVAQRQVLFWDTLRQRGDQFVERTAQGLPPVLHFDYEVVLNGRSFEAPTARPSGRARRARGARQRQEEDGP